MVDSGGYGARFVMQYVGWLAISVAASCGYQELPRLSGTDAPDDGPFMSCMGLAATCGAGANASCCESGMTVPGGPFHRSYDGAGHNDMGFPATVSPFMLDKYEVTVGRFRAFVNAGLGTQASLSMAGAGAHPKLAGSGWDSAWNTNLVANTAALVAAVKCSSTYQTWTDSPGANENKPMNCVTWYEAMAFCIWDGGYLPTEAEWNYAASGGNEQRAYPWSNPSTSTTIDCTYANYFVNSPAGTYCVNGTMGAVSRVGSESPKGDGKWGHSDLAGNVWEWTLDWYVSTYPLPCDDCANLTEAAYRLIRGGSFDYVASGLRVAYRDVGTPSSRGYFIGWRCARIP
jgi:formylglycine-generating enzyme